MIREFNGCISMASVSQGLCGGSRNLIDNDDVLKRVLDLRQRLCSILDLNELRAVIDAMSEKIERIAAQREAFEKELCDLLSDDPCRCVKEASESYKLASQRALVFCHS